MTTRQRPAALGAADARRLAAEASREILEARLLSGLSQAEAARRAGLSDSQLSRIEQDQLTRPTLQQLCRAARAVGLAPSLRFFASGAPVRDEGQLRLLARFERLLGPPLAMRREVPLPLTGDQRAWDARITNGRSCASVEAESRIRDAQAVARRIELKARDDPGAGPVILVLNKTAHNREVLGSHREALRGLFPLDGAAVARHLRAGQVPPAGGLILV